MPTVFTWYYIRHHAAWTDFRSSIYSTVRRVVSREEDVVGEKVCRREQLSEHVSCVLRSHSLRSNQALDIGPGGVVSHVSYSKRSFVSFSRTVFALAACGVNRPLHSFVRLIYTSHLGGKSKPITVPGLQPTTALRTQPCSADFKKKFFSMSAAAPGLSKKESCHRRLVLYSYSGKRTAVFPPPPSSQSFFFVHHFCFQCPSGASCQEHLAL